MASITDKLPPHSLEFEEAVIGSLLIDGSCIRIVSKILKTDDFYSEGCRTIFQSCFELYADLVKIDQLSVAQKLSDGNRLEESGGIAYLSRCIAQVPTSMDAEHYSEGVRALSNSRKLILAGEIIANQGYDNENDGIEKSVALLNKLRTEATISKKLITPHDAGNIAIGLIDKYNNPGFSIQTGFVDLDRISTGLRPGELTIIGARPSIGKTQLLLDIAENIIKKDMIILFVSAEMVVEQLIERKIARELHIDVAKLRSSILSDEQMDKIVQVSTKISERKLSYLTIGVGSDEIYTEACKLKEQDGLDIIFIDYLQKLKDCYGTKENQNIRTGRAVKAISDMAKELNIPVVCASQLNRLSEYRTQENKRPTLADLRDSGSIEQDADNVLLLFRDDDTPDILEVKQAKNRQIGVAPAIKLQWLSNERRYVNATS